MAEEEDRRIQKRQRRKRKDYRQAPEIVREECTVIRARKGDPTTQQNLATKQRDIN